MAHGDAVAVSQTDFISYIYGLTVDGGLILILIVTQHSFFCSIRQRCYSNAAMLTAHITVGSLYLYVSLRG